MTIIRIRDADLRSYISIKFDWTQILSQIGR